MTDFFDKNSTPTATAEEPQTYKIGDEEFSLEDLQGLVADGKFKREVEKNQNTSIDKLNSAYVKVTQERSKWEEEREDYLRLKAEKEANSTPTQIGDLDQATITKAQEEARKLGLFTHSEVEKYMSENFPKFYANQRAGERLLENTERLAQEIDGKDGRPKFEVDEILEYMRETGIRDPKIAYKAKYEKEIDEWKTKELANSRRDGIVTESSSTAGSKQPQNVKPTRDNISSLLSEALKNA